MRCFISILRNNQLAKCGLTQRALDGWDSAAFSGIFYAQAESCSQSFVHARPAAADASRYFFNSLRDCTTDRASSRLSPLLASSSHNMQWLKALKELSTDKSTRILRGLIEQALFNSLIDFANKNYSLEGNLDKHL
jgi:hypothetical protein